HAVSVAEAQLARVAGEGCARHAYLNMLLEASGRHAGRDFADAVHLLCSLHGRYPGLIEIALQRCPKGPVQDWLTRASEGFERERAGVRRRAAAAPTPRLVRLARSPRRSAWRLLEQPKPLQRTRAARWRALAARRRRRHWQASPSGTASGKRAPQVLARNRRRP